MNTRRAPSTFRFPAPVRRGQVDSKILSAIVVAIVVAAAVWWLVTPAAIRITTAPTADHLNLQPVNGKVLVAGRPAVGANIRLIPSDPEAKFQPRGFVDAQGNFTLTTVAKGDGAPPGEYTAIVFNHENPDVDSSQAKLPIPVAYADPEKSPLKVTIVEGTNDLQPFDINGKKKR